LITFSIPTSFPQPLEEELIMSSQEVEKASREVVELRKAVELIRKEEAEKEEERHQIEAQVETDSSMGQVNTGLLVNIDTDITVPADDNQQLSASLLLDGVLIPEKLSEQHEDIHHKQQDSSQNCISQELF